MHDPAEEEIYSVDTGYANAGVVVLYGTVVDAAPIFRWMIGKQWQTVNKWKKIQSIQIAKRQRIRRKISGYLCAECNRLFYEDLNAASECCAEEKLA